MNRGIITTSETGAVIIPTVPVWMTKFEIADLFGVFSCGIRKAIHVIYKNKELNECDTMKYVKQANGISYDVYSLEMVVALAFRINSYGAKRVRNTILERLYLRKEKTSIFSLGNGIEVPKYQA